MNSWLLIVRVALLINIVFGSKVLILMPVGSLSHKNIFKPLAESLSNNGHEVTMVSLYSSDSDKDLPYKDFGLPSTRELMSKTNGEFNVFKMIEKNKGKNVNSEVMKKVIKNLPMYCQSFLEDPDAQNIWEEKPDLIILTALMNECGLILVEKFKAPFIYLTTSGLTPWTADLVGNPENPAYVPNQYLPFTDDMTLLERMLNAFVRIISPILRNRFTLSQLDKVAHNYLGDSSVSLAEVERNVSLVFVNSHHSLGFPRPLQPNVIEVGGMHCRQATSLATSHPRIHEFLESSPRGKTVLFSLGSHIKSSDMPARFLNMFVSAFARLKQYKIIWKWEGVRPENLTSNVLTESWIPQQDILGHPSVGAFFTHGGLLSMQEAVYHGVPLIGLPLMSDQHLNVKQIQALGIGTGLDLYTLTEDDIVNAIKKVVEQPSFSDSIKKRSIIMRDQETTPLDRASYWTEYVLRHNGAAHLRSKSSQMSSFKYFCLDVIAATASILLGALFLLSYTLSKLSVLTKKAAKKVLRTFMLEKAHYS